MSELTVAVLLRRLRVPLVGETPDPPGLLLGRCERAALAAALYLKQTSNADVTAVAVGPGAFEKRALELARRAGCDRAVEVLYAAVDMVDYLGVARVLSAALRREQPEGSGVSPTNDGRRARLCRGRRPDLIVCGGRSQDELVGAVGPAVAELLDVPHLAGVVDVDVDPDSGGESLVITRRADGRLHRYRCKPPLVVCIDEFWRARSPGGSAPGGSGVSPTNDGVATGLPGGAPGSTGRDVAELELGQLELRASELSVRADYIGTAREVNGHATIVAEPAELFSQLAAKDVFGG